MSTPVKVAVLGDLFLDIQASGLQKLPAYDEDNLVDSITFLPGGSAANTARQLAAFPGIECSLLSTAGDDSLCDTFLNYVKHESCHFNLVQRIPHVATASCIVLCSANGGDRGYVTCNGSLDALTPEILVTNEAFIQTAHHLHIAGFFNTPSLQNDELVGILQSFRKKYASLTISLDSNTVSENTDPSAYFVKLLPLLDVLFLNRDELLAILCLIHKQYDTKTGLDTMLNDLIRIGKHKHLLIVVKLGKEGSIIRLESGQTVGCKSCDTVANVNDEEKNEVLKIIDTTGAGDSFNAGFLGEWLLNGRKKSNEEYLNCLCCGNSCGALRCTMVGGCSKPIAFEDIARFKAQIQKQK